MHTVKRDPVTCKCGGLAEQARGCRFDYTAFCRELGRGRCFRSLSHEIEGEDGPSSMFISWFVRCPAGQRLITASIYCLKKQVLDAVARMACLGCEKPYREVVVLLTTSYVEKLGAIESPESDYLVPEAKTELLQVSTPCDRYCPFSILAYITCSLSIHVLISTSGVRLLFCKI